MDFSNSVILPREDFIELSTVAWNQNPPSASERIATVVQTSTICLGISAAFSVGCWAWYKAMSKLEDKKLANSILEAEERQKIRTAK